MLKYFLEKCKFNKTFNLFQEFILHFSYRVYIKPLAPTNTSYNTTKLVSILEQLKTKFSTLKRWQFQRRPSCPSIGHRPCCPSIRQKPWLPQIKIMVSTIAVSISLQVPNLSWGLAFSISATHTPKSLAPAACNINDSNPLAY